MTIDSFGTERLLFRPLSVDDIDELLLLDSDPEVMRYINGGRPSRRDEVDEIVQKSLGHRWMAFDRSTKEFAGWFALRPTGDREYELGYRLHRVAWGKGLATEGSGALVTRAFTDLGADRIWAQTMTVNAASRRVLERCGLRYVRTFHLEWPEQIEGTELGDVEYELLRSEWRH
jgi:RimJ/RimL family protein N-acetyltransferase